MVFESKKRFEGVFFLPAISKEVRQAGEIGASSRRGGR